MKRTIVILILAPLIICACVGTIEKMPGTIENSKYGPTNASEQYGVISYYEAHGEPARENSYKKMYEICNGSYKILNEDIGGSGATVITPVYGGGAIASNSKKVYIKFICNKK